jgi:hypothetical protein
MLFMRFLREVSLRTPKMRTAPALSRVTGRRAPALPWLAACAAGRERPAMASKNKRPDSGGTMGRQDQIGGGTVGLDRGGQTGGKGGVQSGLEERDRQKQRGGIGREPDLEDKQHIQPTHVVD